jgi:hypothetical protein
MSRELEIATRWEGRARQGLEAMRARRRQVEDKRDTLANAAVLPCSMTFRATERSREAITLRREAVRLHRRERQVAPTQGQNDLRVQAPNNRNLSGCSFRFNNRRGTIDVDVSDAMNESSLFIVQIRRLDVTYNHSNATCHRYIRLTMQNRHPI